MSSSGDRSRGPPVFTTTGLPETLLDSIFFSLVRNTPWDTVAKLVCSLLLAEACQKDRICVCFMVDIAWNRTGLKEELDFLFQDFYDFSTTRMFVRYSIPKETEKYDSC